MADELENLAAAEQTAVHTLDSTLRRPGELAQRLFNALGSAIARYPTTRLSGMPDADKVAVALLLRVTNDLRVTSLLALRGYGQQAVALAAGIYEFAYTTAYIGGNNDRARVWIDHDDPTRSVWDVRTITFAVFDDLAPGNTELPATQYRNYRQLCMAKHANPLFQTTVGFVLDGGMVTSFTGPDTTQAGRRAAEFALEHATGLALLALKSFLVHQIQPAPADEVWSVANEIDAEWSFLHSDAVRRWGTNDPFPGKWRVSPGK